MARDEAARKETAASKESSGGVPDVGLAAILRRESILQKAQKETNIDLANRLIQSDNEIQRRNKAEGIQLTSDDDDDHAIHVGQRVRDKGGVTEMLEIDSDDENTMGMRISKSRIYRIANNRGQNLILIYQVGNSQEGF